ncbi:MAG: PHP domain-containing protein [Paraclostridium sp.]
MKNFIHCHVHTHFSNSILTDSPNSPDDYVKKAKELGMKGIIFTEHGNCISWYKKKKLLEENGMKYVHAVEGYVCNHTDQTNSFHILVYAINYDGKNEINRLITKSYLRDGHFYRRPRFTIDELLDCKNIIISTACLAGALNAKEDKSVANKILEWGDKNQGRLFLEIQPHNHPEQIEYNNKLINMNEWGSRYNLIATNDVHYTTREYGDLRKEMQLSKKMNFTDEDSFDLSLKSYDQMLEGFIRQGVDERIAIKALENTNVLYDMIEEYDIDKSFKFPHIYDNAMQEMVNRCLKEFHNKGFTGKQEYVDRLIDELETFKVMGAESYMLLFSDWAKGCLEMDIQWGFSRGSASGSLVSYLLGITDIDPIMWNTSFSRFMNRHRITLADIDVDIPPSQRNQAKKWFYNHPKLNCSEIIAHGTEQEKGSIDAICRSMNISLDDAKKIKSNISDARKSGDWDELFEKVDGLNGCVVSISSHPAGVLVSDLDIESELGLITITDKTADGGARSVCQLNMKELEELGYVKADALGLANIGVINQTFKYINKNRLNPQTCDFNDMNVWNEIRTSPVGIN